MNEIQNAAGVEPIELQPYDPSWPAQFEEERRRILVALGELDGDALHVGSTAVPGLPAKPVIDILLAVRQRGPADRYVQALTPLGYIHVPHEEDGVRLFLRKGAPRSHHLHIVEYGGLEHRRHVAFRDYLRLHPDEARRYLALKCALAERFRFDREGYALAKTEYVQGVEARALAEWKLPDA